VVNELVHKCDVVCHLAAAFGIRLIVEQRWLYSDSKAIDEFLASSTTRSAVSTA
jgi:hypothetical protein